MDLIVVVAAVPDEVAVRARPEGASLRAATLAVVALSVPICVEDGHGSMSLETDFDLSK